MQFQNVYYERKVGTAKPCYICMRPTTTVLATLKTEDFLYTCDGHLSDSGFVIQMTPFAAEKKPTEQDIQKVIADYHAREAKKKDAQSKDKAGSENKDGDQPKEGTLSSSVAASSSSSSATAASPTTTETVHRKYSLQSKIFEARKNELKRREMGVKARQVGQGLPQVPRTAF
ncbi:hypothetical protein L204_102812 [Cryptococcus depauperatus]